jgi:hypothetical protein
MIAAACRYRGSEAHLPRLMILKNKLISISISISAWVSILVSVSRLYCRNFDGKFSARVVFELLTPHILANMLPVACDQKRISSLNSLLLTSCRCHDNLQVRDIHSEGKSTCLVRRSKESGKSISLRDFSDP